MQPRVTELLLPLRMVHQWHQVAAFLMGKTGTRIIV
jgi:hypothetical protein